MTDEGMEDGVENHFGILTTEQIPIETKPEQDNLSSSKMVIDAVQTLINELVDDKPLPALEHQTLDLETDAAITGRVPTMKQYFYPLSLYQHKKTTINEYHLHFSKEGKIIPYEGMGNLLSKDC